MVGIKIYFLFVGKVTKKLPNHPIFAHIFFRTMPSRVTIHNKRNSPHGTFAMWAAISYLPDTRAFNCQATSCICQKMSE